MSTVHVWVDELGTIEYKDKQQPFFGFGSIASLEPLGELAHRAEVLRHTLSVDGVDLTKGFHCRDDKYSTKKAFFELVKAHGEEFHATLLKKDNAYPRVQSKGDMYLYKLAWKLHIQYLIDRYRAISDDLHVVVGSFNTRKRAAEARSAVKDVCSQFGGKIVVSVWDAQSSIGIQAADYCLWATHQRIKGKEDHWHLDYVEPIKGGPVFYPWGT